MPNEPKLFGNRWRMVRTLGQGGQGIVYEVQDLNGRQTESALTKALFNALKAFEQEQHHYTAPNSSTFGGLIDTIRQIGTPLQVAALKELLPADDAVNAATAAARMKKELDVLRRVPHPALIKILDEDPAGKWFVMELFADTMAAHLKEFTGRPLDALVAIRPIVEAASELHKASIVLSGELDYRIATSSRTIFSSGATGA
ncbi:MAG: hypothetical protein ACRD1E_01830 [Terriglobales bacterium]